MFKAREYVKAVSLDEAWQINQKKSSVIDCSEGYLLECSSDMKVHVKTCLQASLTPVFT